MLTIRTSLLSASSVAMSDKKIAYAQKVDEILAKYSKAFLCC